MRTYTKHLKQILLFGLVGGGSLLIDVCVTTLLFDKLHFAASAAGIVGFLSAFFFNFPINRKHVFKHTNQDRFSMKTQIALYASLSAFNLIATAVLMELIVTSGLLKISLAKICVTALIAVWNFFIFKFVVFSKRPDVDELDSLIVQ